ncbi:unnamed protein product, partial [Ectocarpus sp. 8 AP-2014]
LFSNTGLFTRKSKVVTDDDDDDREASEKNMVVVKTQFLRNMAYRIDTDMIRRLTRSSCKFKEISDKSTIPDFVATVFDVGEEYGTMLTNVLAYYDSVNEKFKVVEGPMLIRNIVADAKTDAKHQMLRVSNAPPLIDIDLRHDVPISEMIGDGPVIKECLQELIFNGLRHDSKNHVSVYVTAMSHSPCQVTFSVQNQGIEIQDADVAGIFTPFNSIHRGVVHGCGLGIGLAKCKRMAYELGGDLVVQNGETTTFSLVIPIKHEKELRLQHDGMALTFRRRPSYCGVEADLTDESCIFQQGELSHTAARPCILVVDDSAIARRQFEKMMTHVDIEVDLCDGAMACLEKVKTKDYDLICLDIIMPVMSGVTCAYHLREGDTRNKECPLVIITADSSTETRQLCASISESMVLEKPAKRNVLYRTIMSSIRDLEKREWIRRTWHTKFADQRTRTHIREATLM